MDYDQILMTKIVWYYYFDNMTQQEIGKQMGISRVRVVRLLEKARKEGIVQFRIDRKTEIRMEVEQEVRSIYNLHDVISVPVIDGVQQNEINESIARAAAMYIADQLEDNRFINMGYGDTPNRTLNHLANIVQEPISCISLTGGVNYYLPNIKSNIFNAQLYLIPSPLIVSSEEMVNALSDESSVQDIQRMRDSSAFSVIGIGSMSDNATILQSGIATRNDFLYMKSQGIVGDVLSHFIDKNGDIIYTDFEKRLVSTPLEKIKSMRNVVGVAGGKNKIAAIKAALKGGYLDILITDEETAKSLCRP